MADRLAAARCALRQAQIDYQGFMSGEGGKAIQSYKDGYESLRALVYDGQSHSSERLFDSDVRKGYEWLFKLQVKTAPYRKKARALKDAVTAAAHHLKVVEREVADGR